MSLVATLICNPAEPELDSTAIEAARAALPSPEHADWLFEGIAADIRFSSTEDVRTISARLREAMNGLRIDIVVQPQIDRRKRLLLADMDTSLGLDGAGDFFCDEDGRLARRGGAARAPYVYAGVAILKPELFAETPDGPFSLNLLFDRAIAKGRLFGEVLEGRWLHVGTPEAIAPAEAALAAAQAVDA